MNLSTFYAIVSNDAFDYTDSPLVQIFGLYCGFSVITSSFSKEVKQRLDRIESKLERLNKMD